MIVNTYNFKPHRNRDLTAGGWSQIIKIETQVWVDQYDNAENEVIWLTTDEGCVFARDLFKGETLDKVAAYYAKRGYTDNDAMFYDIT